MAASSVRADEPWRIRLVVRTPELEGPDALVRAPVIVMSPDRLELDGQPMAPGQLEKTLATLKSNYEMLQPGTPFNGLVLLACAPETPTQRVADSLREALAAGYPNLLFAFLREIPGSGTSTGTGLRASMQPAGKAKPAASTIALTAHRDCAELAKALIQARKHSPVVRALVPVPSTAPGRRQKK